jgi:hypothetical protein
LIFVGQPTNADRWARIESEKEPLLASREVYIHPGEMLEIMHNERLIVIPLDVREEGDYNVFHLEDARLTAFGELEELASSFLLAPANTIYVVMSNDEREAEEAWRVLAAEKVPNIYILEGGVNHWLEVFASPETPLEQTSAEEGSEQLRYVFAAAVGDRHPLADPDPHAYTLEYMPKVKLELNSGPAGGGCG